MTKQVKELAEIVAINCINEIDAAAQTLSSQEEENKFIDLVIDMIKKEFFIK